MANPTDQAKYWANAMQNAQQQANAGGGYGVTTTTGGTLIPNWIQSGAYEAPAPKVENPAYAVIWYSRVGYSVLLVESSEAAVKKVKSLQEAGEAYQIIVCAVEELWQPTWTKK